MARLIDEFVAITHRVIARDGFDDYLPTLLLPATKEIFVLEDAPQDSRLPDVARDWAEGHAGGISDFVFAYKIDSEHFVVVARVSGQVFEQTEAVHDA